MRRPNRRIPPLTKQDEARFWSKVDKSPGHGPNGDCWKWTDLGLSKDGYGRFYLAGQNRPAHRVSYVLSTGVDPLELLVCHKCDWPTCVRASHLFAATPKDNSQDMAVKGRAAKGEQNGRCLHPESYLKMRGDTHYSRTNPEKLCRGERHPFHLNPRRGEDHHAAKLTAAFVLQLRAEYASGGISMYALSKKYHLDKATTREAIKGITWKHI